jgi:hypothetical protein
MRRDNEGKTIYTLVAESFFGPDRPLPASYAGPRDSDPDVVLQFPSDVRIERRADGVYYHFHRRYEARPWAYLQNARTTVEEYLKPFEGRTPETMTDAERAGMVKVMARYEMMRFERYARFAFLDVLRDEPQDLWLRVRDAILGATEVLDVANLATLLAGTGDKEADEEALAQAAAAFETVAMDRMRDALRRDAGLAPPRVRAFTDRFERHRLEAALAFITGWTHAGVTGRTEGPARQFRILVVERVECFLEAIGVRTFSFRQRLEPVGNFFEIFVPCGLGHSRVHVGVLVCFPGNRCRKVGRGRTYRQSGRRISDGLQVFEVTVRMARFAFSGRTENRCNVVVTFNIRFRREIKVTAIRLGFSGKCIFQVLFCLAAFQ